MKTQSVEIRPSRESLAIRDISSAEPSEGSQTSRACASSWSAAVFRRFPAVIFVAFLWLLPACSQSNPPAEARRSAEANGSFHDQDPANGEPKTAATAEKMCSEHNVLLAECGICQPQRLAALKPGEGLKVRLAATNSAAMAGVVTAFPVAGSISDAVECYAELAFNQNKYAQITAPVSGMIQEVTADLGSSVREKDTVAKIWSAAIAEAVAKAVLSHQTLERERKLRAERVSSEKDLQQAEADHRAACQQLRTFGFTEEQIDASVGKPQEQVLMEVRAPFAGDIVERHAVRGALVEAGRPLFALADRSVMWAMLSIPEAALGKLAVGQGVEVRVQSLPGRTFKGRLTWIASEVDERSRLVRARAEVPDPEHLLKARMFATVRILARTADQALLVPATALESISGKTFVFVKLAEDLFESRLVTVGPRSDGQVEIASGLLAREEVAINHVFPLKSALLISRLGAGCADD